MRRSAVLLLSVVALGQNVDRDVLARMRAEAFVHSQVETVFDRFTVTIGPRLTASPGHKQAAEFARDWLGSHGLQNARLEPFSFGRGWTLEKLIIQQIETRQNTPPGGCTG